MGHVTRDEEEAKPGPAGPGRYEEAKAAAAVWGSASPSHLQRTLGIRYDEASALVGRMEAEGFCGRRDAAGVRPVPPPATGRGKVRKT